MEEFLDIVDDNDNVVERDTRGNIYKRGLRHNVRVVNIFLFNSKEELLVPKRSKNRKLFPSLYDFSCGEHVISGEDYYSAAVRGMKEELKLSNLKMLELGKLTPRDGVNCFMRVFKVIYDGKINYDHESIESVNFYSLEVVHRMLNETPNKFKPDFRNVFKIFFS